MTIVLCGEWLNDTLGLVGVRKAHGWFSDQILSGIKAVVGLRRYSN